MQTINWLLGEGSAALRLAQGLSTPVARALCDTLRSPTSPPLQDDKGAMPRGIAPLSCSTDATDP